MDVVRWQDLGWAELDKVDRFWLSELGLEFPSLIMFSWCGHEPAAHSHQPAGGLNRQLRASRGYLSSQSKAIVCQYKTALYFHNGDVQRDIGLSDAEPDVASC